MLVSSKQNYNLVTFTSPSCKLELSSPEVDGVVTAAQCCAILIGIGAKSVLKSKIFDTFGIVSVLVLKEVCNRYWYWSRYCKKSLRGIGIGIGIETWQSHGIGIVLVSTYGYVKYWYRFEETYHNCWVLVSVLVSYMPCSGYWYRFRSRIFSQSIGIGIEKNPKYRC